MQSRTPAHRIAQPTINSHQWSKIIPSCTPKGLSGSSFCHVGSWLQPPQMSKHCWCFLPHRPPGTQQGPRCRLSFAPALHSLCVWLYWAVLKTFEDPCAKHPRLTLAMSGLVNAVPVPWKARLLTGFPALLMASVVHLICADGLGSCHAQYAQWRLHSWQQLYPVSQGAGTPHLPAGALEVASLWPHSIPLSAYPHARMKDAQEPLGSLDQPCLCILQAG